MPVTIRPSEHGASSWSATESPAFKRATSPEQLLQATLTDDRGEPTALPKAILQSSFTASAIKTKNSPLYTAKNGLVHACLEAYNNHHRLVLRPDDVWFAILTQLSGYINTHAEELRSTFVEHEGQKALHIEVDPAIPLEKYDHGKLAFEMTKVMSEAIKDASWREWILPAFSTTSKVDQAAASVVFMGAMQKYFTYSWGSRCGLPEVTLLGEVQDWVEIRKRCATKLGTISKATERWARVLKPALDGFVETFVRPEASSTRRFWQGICSVHRPNGSGSTTYSGWLTAFCYWDEQGRCLHEKNILGMDRVRIERGEIPIGFTRVPVTVVDHGQEIATEMIAGSVAIRASRGKGRTKEEDEKEREESGNSGRSLSGLDTVQPEIGWFMYRI